MRPTMDMARQTRAAESPLDAALRAVGDRWTLLVVAALLEQPRRFNDLLADVPGIAPNVLTQRLRNLEGEGLVIAQPYSRRPPRSVYELTDAGRELAGAVRFLTAWGSRRTEGAEESEATRHAACGTPMEARWYCPTCDRAVLEGEAEVEFL